MRLFPTRAGIRTLTLLIVTGCLFAFGMAEGKALKLTVRDSVIDIEAVEAPLAEILKAISAQTGLSLKLGKQLTEPVSLDLRAVSLEEALKRLMANHNYSLTYRKTDDDRFLPEELRVLGVDNPQRAFFLQPQQAFDKKRMPPEDPYHKNFDRTWFSQQFGQANKLSNQIAATPFTEGSVDRGILITRISPESPIMKIGLKAGDVIHNVDGNTISSAQEFLQILSVFQGNERMMRIERRSGNITAPIYINLQ